MISLYIEPNRNVKVLYDAKGGLKTQMRYKIEKGLAQPLNYFRLFMVVKV